MTPQRYIYKGRYREFRGYQFWNGKPVTITDKGTLEAIKREANFEEVKDETKEETQAVLNPDSCPKCGRVIKQGRYMHVKYCKGK